MAALASRDPGKGAAGDAFAPNVGATGDALAPNIVHMDRATAIVVRFIEKIMLHSVKSDVVCW